MSEGVTGHGLKYQVVRRVASGRGESLGFGDTDIEFLTSCGRFSSDHSHARTFASDREADRMVERLASGLPVFITRAAAVAATLGIVLPAWLTVLNGCLDEGQAAEPRQGICVGDGSGLVQAPSKDFACGSRGNW